jgi:hypothetical protein
MPSRVIRGVAQEHNHLAKHISDVEVAAAAPLDSASDAPLDGRRAIRRRRGRTRAHDGGLINMHVPEEASAHLHAMSEAISANQWQSVAIERPARWTCLRGPARTTFGKRNQRAIRTQSKQIAIRTQSVAIRAYDVWEARHERPET